MSRKTAIRITNAEIGAAEFAADDRRDRTYSDTAPTVLDLIRSARGQMDMRELLKRCESAARLELRGWDGEDRKDCAAAIMLHVLEETRGAPPRKDSPRVKLTHLCHLAQNWRTTTTRYRAAVERARQAQEDAHTLSMGAALDIIDAKPLDAEIAAAEESAERAHVVAERICDRLELPRGAAVYARIYQWARGETSEVCADENGVKLSTWDMRLKRGAEMIAALYPDPSALLDELRDEPPSIYRRSRVEWPTREGTDGGRYPLRPETAEDARAASLMRHQCPVPGLAAIGAARLRRGYLLRAPHVKSASPNAPRGYLWVAGKDPETLKDEALKRLGRIRAQERTRDASVHVREAGATAVKD